MDIELSKNKNDSLKVETIPILKRKISLNTEDLEISNQTNKRQETSESTQQALLSSNSSPKSSSKSNSSSATLSRYWSLINPDILHTILSFVDSHRTLCLVRSVCKHWSSVVINPLSYRYLSVDFPTCFTNDKYNSEIYIEVRIKFLCIIFVLMIIEISFIIFFVCLLH